MRAFTPLWPLSLWSCCVLGVLSCGLHTIKFEPLDILSHEWVRKYLQFTITHSCLLWGRNSLRFQNYKKGEGRAMAWCLVLETRYWFERLPAVSCFYMSRLLAPSARRQVGQQRGTLLQGWFLLPMHQVKRLRVMMRAIMPLGSLAITSLVPRGSTSVALPWMLPESGLMARRLFRSALHLTTIATSAGGRPLARVSRYMPCAGTAAFLCTHLVEDVDRRVKDEDLAEVICCLHLRALRGMSASVQDGQGVQSAPVGRFLNLCSRCWLSNFEQDLRSIIARLSFRVWVCKKCAFVWVWDSG